MVWGRCRWPSATKSKPAKTSAATAPLPPTDSGRSDSLTAPPTTKAWATATARTPGGWVARMAASCA
ncbi:hypothetical protein D3C87_1691760 [compost metagenome]